MNCEECEDCQGAPECSCDCHLCPECGSTSCEHVGGPYLCCPESEYDLLDDDYWEEEAYEYGQKSAYVEEVPYARTKDGSRV